MIKAERRGGGKIPRELKNLQCGISYDKGEASIERSSERTVKGLKSLYK